MGGRVGKGLKRVVVGKRVDGEGDVSRTVPQSVSSDCVARRLVAMF